MIIGELARPKRGGLPLTFLIRHGEEWPLRPGR